jgi:hypothetical protein
MDYLLHGRPSTARRGRMAAEWWLPNARERAVQGLP